MFGTKLALLHWLLFREGDRITLSFTCSWIDSLSLGELRVRMTKACLLLLPLIMHSVASCGADANGAVTADAGRQPTPKRHRAAPASCPEERASGSVSVGTECFAPALGNGIAIQCVNDADCVAGSNGRCVLGPKACITYCTYDTCFSDAECPGSQPCECRDSALSSVANSCVAGGNCRVDADCGLGGYCSPSLVGGSCNFDPLVASTGYFCHTLHDSCLNDSDCDQSSRCAFDSQNERWTCVKCTVSF